MEEKSTSILDVMQSMLLHNFVLSKGTISRHLDGSLITLTTVPREWNMEEVKKEREEFGRLIMNGGMHKNLAYIDECGFSIWTAKSLSFCTWFTSSDSRD